MGCGYAKIVNHETNIELQLVEHNPRFTLSSPVYLLHYELQLKKNGAVEVALILPIHV